MIAGYELRVVVVVVVVVVTGFSLRLKGFRFLPQSLQRIRRVRKDFKKLFSFKAFLNL